MKSIKRDSSGVEAFVQRFAATLVEAGVPRMPALVFASLLAEDSGRLTADELVERLNISRAAVSGAVRYLTQVGILRREREPGSRRDHYVFADHTWYEMVARRERVLDSWIATSRDGVAALGPTTPAGKRLADSLAFFEFLAEEMSAMLERWRKRRG